MDSLSLKKKGATSALPTSRTSVTGLLQVAPPSVDLLTRIPVPVADGGPMKVSERLMKYASPLGANVTQGSEARWKSPPFAVVPPAQALKCGYVELHVRPPSCVTAAASPRAPPNVYRSCWYTPMMLEEFVGFTATHGSNSEFT